MAELNKIIVTFASDVQRDDFFAEFACEGETWGEMAFRPASDTYEGAYTLTIFGFMGGQFADSADSAGGVAIERSN